MACKCCDRWGPKRADGRPQPPCRGDEAIEEARKWALTWKARAIASGYLFPKVVASINAAIAKGSAQAAASAQRMMDRGTAQGLKAAPSTPPIASPGDGTESVYCSDDTQDQAVAELWAVGDFARDAIERIAGELDGPKANKAHKSLALRLRAVLRGLEEDRGLDGDLVGLEVDGPNDPALTNLAFCAGPRRHAVRADSPMHEQMLERGCFHCGAYPETVTQCP